MPLYRFHIMRCFLSLHTGRWDKDKLFHNIIIFHCRLSPETPLQKGISVSVATIERKCQLRAHTGRGFIYWLLRGQHCKRSGCTQGQTTRWERRKDTKCEVKKSGVESTEVVQLCCVYMWADLMFLPLRTYFHFQPLPASLQTHTWVWRPSETWRLCRV